MSSLKVFISSSFPSDSSWPDSANSKRGTAHSFRLCNQATNVLHCFHSCVWLEVQREGRTFAVTVWSLPISLDVSVCDTLLILLQLTQCQLPPAPERCFTHPEAVAADTQTQENGGLAYTWSAFTPQWLGWAYLAALFTRLDTSL